ncbi:hypothetical protein KBB96_09150 [Luteolibacter ambystomatis]|uniref:Uncharacterized protein n=1 Tax=Luteolibacter ambystomatis TaxID=2824561 RepID=A0A975J2Z4_9BACT|nr:hypothetical protein [Luteolibacter ambystomatis]QUE53044.1 hypothetical protein KBB96_09150 [Luteolibacter ambystomatis]
MSAAPASEPQTVTARSPLAGCTILIVCVLVLVFLVGFSTWALFRQADEIAKFTSDKPAPIAIAPTEDREADLNHLSERLEGFRQSLDGTAEVKLELSKDDLNTAIAAFPALTELKGAFNVREIREDGKLVLDTSLKMNGKPRRTREGEEGYVTSDPRYLNGTLIARPELADQEIVLRIDSIEVPGASVPEQFRQQMSPYRITERYKTDTTLGPVMKKLTGLTVTGGKVVLRRQPGETAPGTITNDQVDSGAKRLFRWLGLAASAFLALVGLLLFIGMRAKRRKEQEAAGQ